MKNKSEKPVNYRHFQIQVLKIAVASSEGRPQPVEKTHDGRELNLYWTGNRIKVYCARALKDSEHIEATIGTFNEDGFCYLEISKITTSGYNFLQELEQKEREDDPVFQIQQKREAMRAIVTTTIFTTVITAVVTLSVAYVWSLIFHDNSTPVVKITCQHEKYDSHIDANGDGEQNIR